MSSSGKKRSHEDRGHREGGQRPKSSHRDRDEGHEERRVRKKTEKLQQCTLDLDKEIEELEQRHRKVKKIAREQADERKAEFLRQAANLRRRVDEVQKELQQHTEAIARD